jgi:hypothetical protein
MLKLKHGDLPYSKTSVGYTKIDPVSLGKISNVVTGDGMIKFEATPSAGDYYLLSYASAGTYAPSSLTTTQITPPKTLRKQAQFCNTRSYKIEPGTINYIGDVYMGIRKNGSPYIEFLESNIILAKNHLNIFPKITANIKNPIGSDVKIKAGNSLREIEDIYCTEKSYIQNM